MSRFRLHQALAVLVLIAAAAWVLTGKFSRIGSERAGAEEPTSGTHAAAPAEVERRTVQISEPDTLRYSRAIRLSGRTEPDKTSVLAARDSGVIRALPATDGQSVSTGAVLLSLEGPEKLAAIDTATALLIQRKAQAAAAESMLERGGGSRISADIAHSELAAAEAQLREAESAVERLDVIAPFSGVIDDVTVERGSWVQIGTSVMTILSLNPIVVRGELSERDLSAVRIGTPATVDLANGRSVDGLVRYVRHQASPQTRTFQVEVSVPNRGGDVPAGMSAEIVLHADPIPATLVPRSVVTLSDSGALGVRVVEGDAVRFNPVEIVDDTPSGLVLKGVPVGAKVIVSGQDLVKDGELVHAVLAATAVPAAPAGNP